MTDEDFEGLKAENAELKALVQSQAELIAQLQQRLASTSSRTSHSPPSHDGPKERSERKRRARKSEKAHGGQPGHSGHHRSLLPVEQVDHLLSCFPDACHACGELLAPDPDAPMRRHQLVEIPPIRPHVTEYQLHRLPCACGAHTWAPLPLPSQSHFGPRLHALCATLRTQARLSIASTRTLLAELFGLQLSTGALSAIDARAAALLAPEHQQLCAHVEAAALVHLDETPWYLRGERRTLWCAVTPQAALLKVGVKRDMPSARALVGEGFEGVAVTDRYCADHFLPKERRQLCWAHLKRDVAAMGLEPGALGQCGRLLEREARLVLERHKRVRDGTMSLAELNQQTHRKYITSLLSQAARAPGAKKASGVARETLKHEASLWTFLEVAGVEPTNNVAERALRHPVIARKLSFGSQSERGMRWMERMQSVRETLRKQQRSLMDDLCDRFTGTPVLLIPS